MSEFALIYVTCASTEEAARIGEALVSERLAGCVNILPAMQSIYMWEGQVTRADEAVLIAKTLAARVEALSARVRELHSYDCPAILAIPLLHVDADFAKWLKQNMENR